MKEKVTRELDPQRAGVVERLRAMFGAPAMSVRDGIEDALADSTKGEISAQELAMLRSVLSLHQLRVRDIMVPRADIVAVEIEDTLLDILHVFRTEGHSRLPVHGQTLDDPKGMVHIRDFVDFLARQSGLENSRGSEGGDADGGAERAQGRSRSFGNVDLGIALGAAAIIRPVLFVPPSMPVLDLLVKMQAERIHMALVIDEYGGTDGLVSIEDVVEVIVGDIEDEHDDQDAPRIEKEATGSLIADARASIEDIAAHLDQEAEQFGATEDIDTIGGVVTTIAGRVPARGEVISSGNGLEFEILDADPRRVKMLRIRPVASARNPKEEA